MKVCRLHGGKSPQAKARAARDRVRDRALQELVRLGEPEPVTEPELALQALAGEAVAMQKILRRRVAELSAISSQNRAGDEQAHAILSAYERSLDRTAQILGLSARLRIDERVVKIEEDKQAFVVNAMAQAVAWLGLSLEHQVAFRGVVSSLLRGEDARALPSPPDLYKIVEVAEPCKRCAQRDVQDMQGVRPAIAGRVIDVDAADGSDAAPGAPDRPGGSEPVESQVQVDELRADLDPEGEFMDPEQARRMRTEQDVQAGLRTLRELAQRGGQFGVGFGGRFG